MRRGVWLLVLGALAAAVAAASARADGTTTTTTTTGTTATTTTTTTAPTTPGPAYARLTPTYLPAGCVGAGAAAIAEPGRPILALGTPASNRGPSTYPATANVVAFDSSTASGSTCNTAAVTLESVSLLGGAVTAASVEATHAKGTVTGLEIEGMATTLGPGETLAIGNWAQLTLGKRVGRLAAPLVLVLLAPHGGLRAGTVIAVAFAAAPEPVAKPKSHSSPSTNSGNSSQKAASGLQAKKHRGQQPAKPPPDFPASASPFAKGGGFTDAVQDNAVVSTAMRYLGVPYQWGGASPQTGFDCSGFVQYVFGHLGVPLVHYAAAQWHSASGVWVAPNRLQPGDLVFFTGSDGTRKAPGHVGIYVDDGYFIDAPHTGSFVRIDSLTEPEFANQYVGGREIVSPLLIALHLSHVTKPGASATAFPFGFPSPMAIRPLGASIGIAAAGTAVVRTESRGYWVWASVVLDGLLLLSAGAFVLHRRRQTPDAISSSNASN